MSQKQAIFSLMGGRVRCHRGIYNPTSDAVWLAAFAPTGAKSVLDVGTGTGAVAMCLMANNPSAQLTGLDISEQMLAAAADNAILNERAIELIHNDIIKWKTDRTFDLVVSNPPYFKGTPATHNAHHNANLTAWTTACLRRVRPRGYFCTIVDAGVADQVISAMRPTCGDINIFPLFGAKDTAERVIIRGRTGVHSPSVIHRGLPMNYDPVLRDGLTIDAALARLNEI